MHSRLYSRAARVSSFIALLHAGACKQEAPAPPPASIGAGGGAGVKAASRQASAAEAPEFPPLPSQEDLPTTAGNIAFGNLEGDVQNADKLLTDTPNNSELMMRVVPIYLMHGKTAGQLQEYDRALALAEKAVKLQPKSPEAWSALSSVHSTFHQFEEALADLKRAEEAGGKGTKTDMSRAALYQAMGRYAEARPVMEKLAAETPRVDTLGALATLDADENRIADAERHFAAAQSSIRDVTPFPVVWLWFQQGLMWQKEGRLSRARELFAAAHERLPADVAVASHLAAMYAATGDRERAVAILRQVVLSAYDPEYLGQLSQLLREDGAGKEADELRAQAITRYEDLIKRHPAAFAEHAARFWLGPGGDPKKAVQLAKQNLEHRKTSDAYALLLEARESAQEPAADTCQLAEQALAARTPPPARLRVLASRAFLACGKKDRADAELAAVSANPAVPAPASAPASAPAPATAPAPHLKK